MEAGTTSPSRFPFSGFKFFFDYFLRTAHNGQYPFQKWVGLFGRSLRFTRFN